MRRLLAAFGVWLFCADPHLAMAANVINASRIQDDAIDVDGVATDAAWSDAHWYEDFVQRDPKEGARPSERTRVAVVYDSRAIYIFVRAEDNQADRVFASLTRRDRASPSDWVEVWLAPQADRRSGYRFAVNAAGVQWTDSYDLLKATSYDTFMVKATYLERP